MIHPVNQRRVVARCVLLEIALREALDYRFERQPMNDEVKHTSRQLRREIRAAR